MSLLDFDNSTELGGGEGQGVTSGDPFDPFSGMSSTGNGEEASSAGNKPGFDDFDPFADFVSSTRVTITTKSAAPTSANANDDPFGDPFSGFPSSGGGGVDASAPSDAASNPFSGGGDDPFGLGSPAPESGGTNPFGGGGDFTSAGDDPFGLGSVSADSGANTTNSSNPFGAADSSDPFGGFESNTAEDTAVTAVTNEKSKMADLDAAGQQALSAQFDDLMGDMTLNGDDVSTTFTMTTTKTVVEEDGLSSTVTKTTTSTTSGRLTNGEGEQSDEESREEQSRDWKSHEEVSREEQSREQESHEEQSREEESRDWESRASKDEDQGDDDTQALETSEYFNPTLPEKYRAKPKDESNNNVGDNKALYGDQHEVEVIEEVTVKASKAPAKPEPPVNPYEFDFMDDLITREVDSKMKLKIDDVAEPSKPTERQQQPQIEIVITEAEEIPAEEEEMYGQVQQNVCEPASTTEPNKTQSTVSDDENVVKEEPIVPEVHEKDNKGPSLPADNEIDEEPIVPEVQENEKQEPSPPVELATEALPDTQKTTEESSAASTQQEKKTDKFASEENAWDVIESTASAVGFDSRAASMKNEAEPAADSDFEFDELVRQNQGVAAQSEHESKVTIQTESVVEEDTGKQTGEEEMSTEDANIGPQVVDEGKDARDELRWTVEAIIFPEDSVEQNIESTDADTTASWVVIDPNVTQIADTLVHAAVTEAMATMTSGAHVISVTTTITSTSLRDSEDTEDTASPVTSEPVQDVSGMPQAEEKTEVVNTAAVSESYLDEFFDDLISREVNKSSKNVENVEPEMQSSAEQESETVVTETVTEVIQEAITTTQKEENQNDEGELGMSAYEEVPDVQEDMAKSHSDELADTVVEQSQVLEQESAASLVESTPVFESASTVDAQLQEMTAATVEETVVVEEVTEAEPELAQELSDRVTQVHTATEAECDVTGELSDGVTTIHTATEGVVYVEEESIDRFHEEVVEEQRDSSTELSRDDSSKAPSVPQEASPPPTPTLTTTTTTTTTTTSPPPKSDTPPATTPTSGVDLFSGSSENQPKAKDMDFSKESNDWAGARRVTVELTREPVENKPTTFGGFEISPSGALGPPKDFSKSTKTTTTTKTSTKKASPAATSPSSSSSKFGMFEISPSGALIPPSHLSTKTEEVETTSVTTTKTSSSSSRHDSSSAVKEEQKSSQATPKSTKPEPVSQPTFCGFELSPTGALISPKGMSKPKEEPTNQSKAPESPEAGGATTFAGFQLSPTGALIPPAKVTRQSQSSNPGQDDSNTRSSRIEQDDYAYPVYHSSHRETKDDSPAVYITMSEQLEEQRRAKQRDFLYGAGAGNPNQCHVCGKRVYEMEKVSTEKALFHKSCFKCSHCHRFLTMGNIAMHEERLYCQQHLNELLKAKGPHGDALAVTSERAHVTDTPPIASSETGDELSERTEPEVIRSYDTVEELPENLPSISSIKSRFESQPQQQQQVHISRTSQPTYHTSPAVNGYEEDETDDVISRDEQVARESREKEQVHFAEMSSVRNKFQSLSSQSPGGVAPARKQPSKWDKPATPVQPAPVLNRSEEVEEEREESELPPAGLSRNLAARFQSPQSATSASQRKPVRKMTPPQDMLEEQINQVQDVILERAAESQEEYSRDPDVVRSDNVCVREEELPSPAYTRTMLARFREIEASSASAATPPSPTHSQLSSVSKASVSVTKSEPAQRSPATTTPAQTPGKASISVTKSVTTQRSPAITTPAKTPGKASISVTKSAPAQRSPATTAPPAQTQPGKAAAVSEKTRIASPDSGIADSALDNHTQARVEEPETVEEELPQAGQTRNLLAQWRTLETSPAPRTPTAAAATPSSGGKVKRANTVASAEVHRNAKSPAAARKSSLGDERHAASPASQHQQRAPAYEDTAHARDDVVRGGDDSNEADYLPPPKFTRSLLAKFQTLESSQQRPATSPTKKESQYSFKWQVKAATPLFHAAGPEYERVRYELAMASVTPTTSSRDSLDQLGEPVTSPAFAEDEEERNRRYYYGDEEEEEEQARHYQQERDVVSADATSAAEDELPPPSFTRNLLAKFKSMEDVSRPAPTPEVSRSKQREAYTMLKSPATGPSKYGVVASPATARRSSSGNVQPEVVAVYDDEQDTAASGEYGHYQDRGSSEYGHYQDRGSSEDGLLGSGGEYESEPAPHASDVVREQDVFDEGERPAHGTTRNLMARWQQLQSGQTDA